MAPSPTGFFHVGSARTALYNWLFARHHQGQFILRIEDTDTARSSQDMIDVIKDGLRWLELDWDEEYFQSQRLANYATFARQLVHENKAYYCFCRPEDLQREKQEAYRNKKDWRYDRRCLHLSEAQRTEKIKSGIPGAIRFLVPDHPVTFHDVVLGDITREPSNIEDFIILRADGTPTYNLACVIDDHDMNITHVIRGADHVTNTPKQILLYEALQFAQPVFAHLPLILGKDKAKLSKRHGAISVTEYRSLGYVPDAMVNYLALLGWSPGTDQEVFPDRDGLIRQFSLERISPSAAVFDHVKLEWMNQQHIMEMDPSMFMKMFQQSVTAAGLMNEDEIQKNSTWFARVSGLMQPRLKRFSDVAEQGRYFFTDDFTYDPRVLKRNLDEKKIHLMRDFLSILGKITPFTADTIERALRVFTEERNVKARELIHPLRAFATGTDAGPPLFDTLELIGKERCINRIQKIIDEQGAGNAKE
jgi:glutamyl-tRNA synthetase